MTLDEIDRPDDESAGFPTGADRRIAADRPQAPYRRKRDGRPVRRMLRTSLRALQGIRPAPTIWLVVALIAGALPDGYFQVTSNWLFDAYQRISPAERSPDRITIIDIDEESLYRMGQWPWPRTLLGRLIDAAHQAKVIGVDLVLSEPDRLSPENWAKSRTDLPPAVVEALSALPSTDRALAQTFTRTPVVLAVPIQSASRLSAVTPDQPLPVTPVEIHGLDPVDRLLGGSAFMAPLSVLADKAAGIGIVSVNSEFDGVLRRIPLIFDIDHVVAPSFAAEVVRVAAHTGPLAVEGDDGGVSRLAIGDIPVRSDLSGRVWPRYSRLTPAQEIPAWRVLDGTADPALFRDRIVLIGATAAGLRDVVVTPLRQTAPGVAAHAQLIGSILDRDSLWRPPQMIAVELLLTLMAGLCAQLLPRHIGIRRYCQIFALAGLLLIATSFTLFKTTGLLLDWTFPLTAVAGTSVLALASRARREVLRRRGRERELANALLTLEVADRAKTEFLANVSHELRTPLSAVIGFSDVMTRQIMGPLSPVYADYAKDINESGRHLLSIIDDILDLSVLQLGGARVRQDRISLGKAIEECRRMMIPRAENRGVMLRVEADPGLPDLLADRRMLKQMVINLMSNGVKYAPSGSDVTIRSALQGGWLCISVADLGPGIASGDLAKVTQRFGRLQSARLAQEPGLGIGLALTKSMIELHGGRLEVESTVGIGTRARLWFPPETILSTEGK